MKKEDIIKLAKEKMDIVLKRIFNSQMNESIYLYAQTEINKISDEYKYKYGIDPLSELSMNKPELKMIKKEN